jgi:hypothetical protein
VKVGPVLRDPLTSSDIEKKTISAIEKAEILSSSWKLQSPLDEKESQCKTMPFENSELLPGTSHPLISRSRDYASDYEPSKQLQREAKAQFLISHSQISGRLFFGGIIIVGSGTYSDNQMDEAHMVVRRDNALIPSRRQKKENFEIQTALPELALAYKGLITKQNELYNAVYLGVEKMEMAQFEKHSDIIIQSQSLCD